MAIILDKKDFVGEYQFQFSNNIAYWDNVINIQEELALKKLFGDALFTKLKTDPNDVDFAPLFAPYINGEFESRGLKTCILAFVYSQLIISNGVYAPNGVSKVKSEVTEAVYATENYSRAVNSAIYDAWAIRNQLQNGVSGLEDYNFCYNYILKQYLW